MPNRFIGRDGGIPGRLIQSGVTTMPISTLVLLGYAVLLLALGALLSRGVKHSSQFFIAGRGLGPGLIFSTLLAANIGAGSTVGASGLAYREGLSAWWWVGSAGIGSAILGFSVGPRIWHVAREHNLYTVGDYLELRYNRAVRDLAALLLWMGSLVILAGQFIAIAWILYVTLGTSKPLGCALAALVTTAYFAAGGLHASARVNVLQLAVKLAGFSLALCFLWFAGHSWPWLKSAVTDPGLPPGYWSFGGAGAPSILNYICMLAPSFLVSPGILQKLFGARDARSVRIGVALNAAGLFLFAIVPVLMGLIAKAGYPHLANSELALPTLVMHELPWWLGGLLLGAILSAELSAADAVLFMLTTSLSRDLYQRRLRPDAGETGLMQAARATAVFCGLLAAGLGIVIPNVISALSLFYTLLTAAFFLPVVAGLYWEKVTARAMFFAMVVSLLVCFACAAFPSGGGFLGLPPTALGILAGTAILAGDAFIPRGSISRRGD